MEKAMCLRIIGDGESYRLGTNNDDHSLCHSLFSQCVSTKNVASAPAIFTARLAWRDEGLMGLPPLPCESLSLFRSVPMPFATAIAPEDRFDCLFGMLVGSKAECFCSY